MYRRVDIRQADFQPAAIGSDETTALFQIKVGERVVFASAELLIAADGSTNSTATLGDGTSVNGYVTSASGSGNIDLEASTVGVANQGTGALLLASGGKLYTVDDTIDVVYTNGTEGATNPKVRYRIGVIREK